LKIVEKSDEKIDVSWRVGLRVFELRVEEWKKVLRELARNSPPGTVAIPEERLASTLAPPDASVISCRREKSGVKWDRELAEFSKQ